MLTSVPLLPSAASTFGVDDVLRRGAAGAGDHQKIRRRRERLQIRDESIRHVLRLAAGVGDLHPHRRDALGDRLADAAEAEDADRPAAELGRELRPALRPFARLHEAVEAHEAAAGHHDQRDGDVGDVVGQHVRRVRHLDAAPAAVIDRHAVVADAEHRDDLERRQRVEQRRRRHRAAALHQAADLRALRREQCPACRSPGHSRGSDSRPSADRRGTAAAAR